MCSIAGQSVNGQTTDPPEIKAGLADLPSALKTAPVPSNMEFISMLLQTELKKDNQTMGRVHDVAFDLETEHLCFL